MSLKVFVSYAKEDQELALKYYDLLLQEGTTPWIDVKNLLPGQNWEAEIEKAFSDANIVVILLSSRSVSKRGFVQREAHSAIERLRYRQPTDIYVLPLLLEPCEVPSYITGRLQYIDLTIAGAWNKVQSSLKIAAAQQSIELTKGINAGPFRFFTRTLTDQWHGTPGHDIKIEYPVFESATLPIIAEELTLYFSGRAAATLFEARQSPWDQTPELFPLSPEFPVMDGRWDNFGIAYASSKLVSLAYNVSWYGAGAAHPNSHFETYNFLIQDRVHFLHLSHFLNDERVSIPRISELCVASLSREYWNRVGEKPDDHQIEWFHAGAGPALENFKSFTIHEGHFTFLFPPYQVSAYAMGEWSVDISFYDLLDVIRTDRLKELAVLLDPR